MREYKHKLFPHQKIRFSEGSKSGWQQFGQNRAVRTILHMQRKKCDQALSPFSEGKEVETNSPRKIGGGDPLVPIRAAISSGIQTKPKINTPGDIYEQEADWIAEQVMKQDLQDTGDCKDCKKTDPSGEKIAAEKTSGNGVSGLDSMQKALQGGVPLTAAERGFFEPRMNADFRKVRVHKGQAANESAAAFGARAYAYGDHIVVGGGEYDFNTSRGKRLMAHELAHVTQQKPVSKREKGNGTSVQKSVAASVIQRSPLSDELAEILSKKGKDDFFDRLQKLQISDPDVIDLVNQTLTGDDQIRAKAIMGLVVLDSDTRGALIDELVFRLASAQDDFDRAVGMVEQDLAAEDKAKAELIGLFVSIATVFIVPGLGGAISRLVNRLPAAASVGMHRAALAIQDQAPNIASAVGEWGKKAATDAISKSLASNPRDFFNALREGFQASNSEILQQIRSNISDPLKLPDYKLYLYVANWDTQEITANQYASLIRREWRRYEQQVLSIGQFRAHVLNAFTETMSSSVRRLVRVQSGGKSTLALVDYKTLTSGFRHTSEYRWVTAVSPDLQEMALAMARSKGQRDIPVLNTSEVSGVPSKYR